VEIIEIITQLIADLVLISGLKYLFFPDYFKQVIEFSD